MAKPRPITRTKQIPKPRPPRRIRHHLQLTLHTPHIPGPRTHQRLIRSQHHRPNRSIERIAPLSELTAPASATQLSFPTAAIHVPKSNSLPTNEVANAQIASMGCESPENQKLSWSLPMLEKPGLRVPGARTKDLIPSPITLWRGPISWKRESGD